MSRSTSGKLIFIAALALLAGMVPARAADPLPPTNDFILRAAEAEAAGIASRNGLTIVSQIATAVDEDGHGIYLVRAASGALPERVISDVETLEPEAAGIEHAVLASLPKLDQSTAMILDTSTVDSALGAINGFEPPTATVSATWNGHLHDRRIEAGKTEKLEFGFEHAADTDPAAYSLRVDFADGTTARFDPSACVAVVRQVLDIGGQEGKWTLVNTSADVITLDSLAAGWPTANGNLIEIKLDGDLIYDQDLPPASATIDSGWLNTVGKRQLDPGDARTLKLKWLDTAAPDVTAYTLSVTTAEGHSAAYDPAGGPCAAHVDDVVAVSDHQARFDVSNYSAADQFLVAATLTWPASNGKLMTARLHDDSVLDAPYQKFGSNPDGSEREVWTGYVNQPATQALELDRAQEVFKGEATVAIIDTGIDPTHPILAGNIVPGYDFVNDIAGAASEWADVDQSTAMILDQSTAMILDQSTAMILDTSTLPPAFGHGTMVAGVIHRTAPEARLMPLKAFDAGGHAHLYDIVEAIYYAVEHGANVINMSFSMEAFSPALMRAVNHAARSGVACIAAAGNRGEELLVFPASFGNTVGVASVSDSDELSAFSNWGSDLVTISAPGESIVTTFPGGRFAVASGTSFSAPWVAGGAAIFADKLGTKHAPGLADYYLTSNALSEADAVSGDGRGKTGYGRANLRRAVDSVKSGHYSSNRPLGVYTLTATFAEGCAASYPPPSTSGGCTVDGAGQLAFDGKKVLWDLDNTGEVDVTLDSITISWETDNGQLKKIKLDGAELDNTVVAPVTYAINTGWSGAVADRIIAPHETVPLLFEFEHDVIWTY